MEITHKITLKPFSVPNFVLVEGKVKPRQEGFQPQESYALKDLDSDTLGKLCDEFVISVFKKAGKDRPATEET